MSHVILRGKNGRRHDVSFEDDNIQVELYASAETVELVVEAQDTDCLPAKRRFVLVNIPRHLFSKAMADLARQDREHPRPKG